MRSRNISTAKCHEKHMSLSLQVSQEWKNRSKSFGVLENRKSKFHSFLESGSLGGVSVLHSVSQE